MQIGENIKARRKQLNMTQQELANKLGYKSVSTIAKIEAGKNDIPQSKIIAFAKALDTTAGALMGLSFEGIPNIVELEYSGVDNAIQKALHEKSQLTYRDERQIAADLEKMLADLDNQNAMAAMGGTVEDDEDRELLRASLLATMRLAKKIAKEKYTPKKYRQNKD